MKRTLNYLIVFIVLVPMLVSCGTGGTYAAATSQPATQTPIPPAGSTEPPASVPTNTPLPAAGATDIKIQGFAFDPPTLTVKAGTTVTWTNNDSATHTVVSDAGDWSSGDLATGATFSHTFDTAGTFSYHCGVHPAMKGKIVVQ